MPQGLGATEAQILREKHMSLYESVSRRWIGVTKVTRVDTWLFLLVLPLPSEWRAGHLLLEALQGRSETQGQSKASPEPDES